MSDGDKPEAAQIHDWAERAMDRRLKKERASRAPGVYLAGGFFQEFKPSLVARLESRGIEVLDPEAKGERHHIPGCYVGLDLEMIRAADAVLAYLGDYPYVYGMAAECGYACALDIPIIFVCLAPRVDSFLSGLARATFTSFEPAVEFLAKRFAREGGRLL
jgi:nucleoside 2-deoxyribosyltransferase